MDMESYTRFVFSLLVVLGMIFVVAALLRRFGPVGPGMRARRGAQRRVQVVEATMLDPRRRLLLVRRDDREHLLLIGGGNDVVVETGIQAAPESLVPDAATPMPKVAPKVAPNLAPTEAMAAGSRQEGGHPFRSLLDRVTGRTP